MPNLNTTRTRIADLGKPRIIIIGGGFGGLEDAKGLEGFKAQTVFFDKYNHHCFQSLSYQVATSWLQMNSIAFPFRFKNEDFFFRLDDMTNIKPEENYIETSIGGVHYDNLVIATGASTNFYSVVDLGNLKWQRFFAWLIWMFVPLISLIDFKNRLFVLFNWTWSYLSYFKSNRLIIARPKDGVN